MLKKGICKLCRFRHGTVWMAIDDLRWKVEQKVHCPKAASERGQKVLYSTQDIPSNCPFHLEHVLSEKKG